MTGPDRDSHPMIPAADPLREAAETMRAVRDRCVWTQQIDHRALVPYLVEESAELIDAVEDGTRDEAILGVLAGSMISAAIAVILLTVRARHHRRAGTTIADEVSS